MVVLRAFGRHFEHRSRRSASNRLTVGVRRSGLLPVPGAFLVLALRDVLRRLVGRRCAARFATAGVVFGALAFASVGTLAVVDVPFAWASDGVLMPYGASGYSFKIVQHGDLAGFESPSFDAAAAGFQTNGIAPFSNGARCGYPSATDWPADTDLLVRREVTVPADVFHLTVSVAIDNDEVVYWNGTQIGSDSHDGCASNDSFTYAVPPGLVNSGANLLAIRAIDRGAGTYFDATVRATPALSATELTGGGSPSEFCVRCFLGKLISFRAAGRRAERRVLAHVRGSGVFRGVVTCSTSRGHIARWRRARMGRSALAGLSRTACRLGSPTRAMLSSTRKPGRKSPSHRCLTAATPRRRASWRRSSKPATAHGHLFAETGIPSRSIAAGGSRPRRI